MIIQEWVGGGSLEGLTVVVQYERQWVVDVEGWWHPPGHTRNIFVEQRLYLGQPTRMPRGRMNTIENAIRGMDSAMIALAQEAVDLAVISWATEEAISDEPGTSSSPTDGG